MWCCLHQLLARIPRRHALVLLGDFNVSIPICLPHISYSDPSGNVSDECKEVLQLVRTYHLWLRTHKAAREGITFGFPCGLLAPLSGTRIDYAFLRQGMRCRQMAAETCWDSPFLWVRHWNSWSHTW